MLAARLGYRKTTSRSVCLKQEQYQTMASIWQKHGKVISPGKRVQNRRTGKLKKQSRKEKKRSNTVRHVTFPVGISAAYNRERKKEPLTIEEGLQSFQKSFSAEKIWLLASISKSSTRKKEKVNLLCSALRGAHFAWPALLCSVTSSTPGAGSSVPSPFSLPTGRSPSY